MYFGQISSTWRWGEVQGVALPSLALHVWCQQYRSSCEMQEGIPKNPKCSLHPGRPLTPCSTGMKPFVPLKSSPLALCLSFRWRLLKVCTGNHLQSIYFKASPLAALWCASFKKHLVYYLLPRGDFHVAHPSAARAPLLSGFYAKVDFQRAKIPTKVLQNTTTPQPWEKPTKLLHSRGTCDIFLVSSSAICHPPAAWEGSDTLSRNLGLHCHCGKNTSRIINIVNFKHQKKQLQCKNSQKWHFSGILL